MRQLTLLKFAKYQILIQYIRVLFKNLSDVQIINLGLDHIYKSHANTKLYYYIIIRTLKCNNTKKNLAFCKFSRKMMLIYVDTLSIDNILITYTRIKSLSARRINI
jgi:hypothetical protein